MKLASKLALAAVLILVTVFALRAYETAKREIARAAADLREGQFIVGRALRPAIREVWRLEGRKRALQVLDIADERIQRARSVKIAWVPFHPLPARYQSLIGPADLERLRESDDATVVRMSTDRLVTYIPLHVGRQAEGAFEISEPLQPYQARWRADVRAVLGRAGAGAAVSILAVSALGFVMVGRPTRKLCDFAKRIGSGDLGGSLVLRQRDEIGELAREMNRMCERLREADDRLRRETAARIGAMEQLRHTDRLRTVGTLASGIAHELGTPLNVVSGRAKMVASGEVAGPEAADSCRVIVDQVDRIAKIIRQLLDFARRRSPDRGPCQLEGLATQTLNLLRPMAQKRGVALVLDQAESGLQAEVDPGQVQQALANLVVNGIQAMEGSGKVTVSLATARLSPPPGIGGPTSEYAKLTVQDEGEGIPEDLLPRIFEPFFTTKEVGEGTGLGLSVAYGIARDHGGWIAADSKPGAGSRFDLFVPVRPAGSSQP
jgi:two-component system, NtrC family, sensor kinase